MLPRFVVSRFCILPLGAEGGSQSLIVVHPGDLFIFSFHYIIVHLFYQAHGSSLLKFTIDQQSFYPEVFVLRVHFYFTGPWNFNVIMSRYCAGCCRIQLNAGIKNEKNIRQVTDESVLRAWWSTVPENG